MGPSREACDRCHDMKTRCVRPSASTQCMRCTRLGVSCTYSPPGRAGRPVGRKRNRGSCDNTRPSSSLTDSQFEASFPCSTTEPNPFNNIDTNVTLDGDQAFLSESCPEQEAMSVSFMEDFLSNLSQPESIATTTATDVTTSPNTNLTQASSIDWSISATSDLPQMTALYPSNPISEHQELLHQLLDFQLRITKLIKYLSVEQTAPEDIEELYRVSSVMIGIVDGVKGVPTDQASNHRPNGVVILTISSCYHSLLHAYGLLVKTLNQELDCNENGSDAPGMMETLIPGVPKRGVPSISIGAVRLAVPREAVAKVNLYLVAETIKQLKSSMDGLAARLFGNTQTTQNGGSINCSNLTRLAVEELNEHEECLINSLSSPSFLVNT